jgi:hypothetical protein
MDDVRSRFAFLISTVSLLTALFLFGLSAAPPSSFAQENLLPNGDLAEGLGNSPRYWQSGAWATDQSGVTFDWLADNQPPELEVWNQIPADARWVEIVHLDPGWYHVVGSVRTEGVPKDGMGGNISIMDSWIASQQVTGTSGWQTVGFYVQVGAADGADVGVSCRLGFYSALNTGKAFFRNLKITQVSAPPPVGDPAFNLEEDRQVPTS